MIGLPSLQAIDRAQGARIWMGSEATDMRYGFDRLAERVKTVIGENPQSGHLFVFRSRRGDWLKIWFGIGMDSCRGTLASLASSCRRHEMDPQLYFMQLLMNLPPWPANDLDAWLIDRWKQAHADRCAALEIPLSIPEN